MTDAKLDLNMCPPAMASNESFVLNSHLVMLYLNKQTKLYFCIISFLCCLHSEHKFLLNSTECKMSEEKEPQNSYAFLLLTTINRFEDKTNKHNFEYSLNHRTTDMNV